MPVTPLELIAVGFGSGVAAAVGVGLVWWEVREWRSGVRASRMVDRLRPFQHRVGDEVEDWLRRR